MIFGLFFLGQPPDFPVIDVAVAANAVLNGFIKFGGEIDLPAVGEVAAERKGHPHYFSPGFNRA